MNPNISEAARRAAEAVKGEFPGSLFGVSVEDLVRLIQSALDSAHPAPLNASSSHGPMGPPGGDGKGEAKVWNAGLNLYAPDHPAPKEGATPETDAVELAVGKWLARYAGKSFTLPEVANYIHNEFDAVRSLELRLASAKAELEQWKRTALKDREDHVNLRNLCGPALAHSDCEIVALRERLQKAEELLEQAHRFLDCDYEVRVGQLPARIRTFLNQDKT